MSASLSHEIVVVATAGEPEREELLQKCFDIRIDVFHREQGFPLEVEFDDLDATATHFLLRLTPSLQPVGTIRAWKGKGYYQLGRLAVLTEWRKHHFGRELVLALHDWIRRDAMASGTQGTVRIQCHSQLYAKPFYAKLCPSVPPILDPEFHIEDSGTCQREMNLDILGTTSRSNSWSAHCQYPYTIDLEYTVTRVCYGEPLPIHNGHRSRKLSSGRRVLRQFLSQQDMNSGVNRLS